MVQLCVVDLGWFAIIPHEAMGCLRSSMLPGTQVFRGSNRQDVVGVILVKELLEYVKHFPDSEVSCMKIRQLPR